MPIRQRIKRLFKRDIDPLGGSSRASTPDQSTSTSANVHVSYSSPALLPHAPMVSPGLPTNIGSPGLPAPTDRTNSDQPDLVATSRSPASTPPKVQPRPGAIADPTLSVSASAAAPPPSTVHGPTKIAWSGVKTFLGLLNESADAFGPLKSAVGGIVRCIEIYEVPTMVDTSCSSWLTVLLCLAGG
jgi:hypothetical protein